MKTRITLARLSFPLLFAVAALLGSCLSTAIAQDPRDEGFYSPDDWHRASWIQRVATGHAGFYRNCDDDASKRWSPYIEWTCKPQGLGALPPRQTLSTIPADLQRKTDRHLWGQGGCAPVTRDCRPPSPLNLLRLPPELLHAFPSQRAQ